jgi:anchored repeat ABC transporter substrate-binding protein
VATAIRRRLSFAIAAVAAVALLSGCVAKPVLSTAGDRLRVVTTTGLLGDLVAHVGGDEVEVAAIVPDGADPHSYEPTFRDARNVVYADVAFSNYALLEEHSIIKTLDANLRDDAMSVSLAEEAVKYAAEIIPLVENLNLDTIWLGLRVRGEGGQYGATRASEVVLTGTDVEGPGDLFAYLTGSFGDTDIYLDSSDGFDAANGYRDDSVALPANAHTHLSWAFSEPGIYRLTMEANLRVDATSQPIPVGSGTYTFAVGVDPSRAGIDDPVVLESGHADLSVDLDDRELVVVHDPEGHHGQSVHDSTQVVIWVPPKALDEIPAGAQFRFLGRPGDDVYQLPQAVLGKHVHGEIDPHLWQDVRNAMAYVRLIRDTLVGADPEHAREYTANAAAYLAELEATDDYVRATIAEIPVPSRHLVTTHDAFGYLAHAYGVSIAGFVTPNPATEPSLADRRKITETLRALDIRAVFLEPNLAARSSTLVEVATQLGIQVCSIYSDTFDERVDGYVEMMRANAESLRDCLTE